MSKRTTKKKPPPAAKPDGVVASSHVLTPPEEPDPDASEDARARYQAEHLLFLVRQKHLGILDLEAEKKRGVEERRDKINNLTEAMLSVIREESHDKPVRELERCRKWQLEVDKREHALAEYTRTMSDRLKAMRGEFHDLVFGEQLSLPGTQAAPNGTKVEHLARELAKASARVKVKVGRRLVLGTVHGADDETLRVRLDQPTTIRGQIRETVEVRADKVVQLPAG